MTKAILAILTLASLPASATTISAPIPVAGNGSGTFMGSSHLDTVEDLDWLSLSFSGPDLTVNVRYAQTADHVLQPNIVAGAPTYVGRGVVIPNRFYGSATYGNVTSGDFDFVICNGTGQITLYDNVVDQDIIARVPLAGYVSIAYVFDPSSGGPGVPPITRGTISITAPASVPVPEPQTGWIILFVLSSITGWTLCRRKSHPKR